MVTLAGGVCLRPVMARTAHFPLITRLVGPVVLAGLGQRVSKRLRLRHLLLAPREDVVVAVEEQGECRDPTLQILLAGRNALSGAAKVVHSEISVVICTSLNTKA